MNQDGKNICWKTGNYIEHLQNYTTEKFLKDFKEQFPSENISKEKVEKFIKSYLRVLVTSIFVAGKTYEKNMNLLSSINC